MTIKVRNIGRWSKLEPDSVLQLKGDARRRVKLDVNTEAQTRVAVIHDAGTTFLASVAGLHSIEFVVEGAAEVVMESDGEIWFATDDMAQNAFYRPEAVKFTTIAGRRSRNPELEMLMFKAEQRMNARLAMQQAEFEALISSRGEHDPVTGEVDENGGGAGTGELSEAAGEQAQPAAPNAGTDGVAPTGDKPIAVSAGGASPA